MSWSIEPTQAIRRAFSEMTQAEAAEIVAAGNLRTYPEDTILCKEGSTETTFYVIMDGQVKVSKYINEKEDRFLCYLSPGDFFGEMALIHNAPRTASVVTTRPTTVLEVCKAPFDELVRRNSSVSVAMVREVSRRLRENNEMAVEDLRMKASELASAYQQLAEVEHAKSEFLTVVAHELRTPLTIANGFLQMINSHQMQGEALYSALNTVARNVQDIISLTNDVLFLQEMDFILPEFMPAYVSQIVQTVVAQNLTAAEAAQVTLKVTIAPSLPQFACDARSLERAISELVDNAIKFSPDGGEVGVVVDYDLEKIWVRVTDHGVGIPPDALPRVFERFFHLEEVGGHLFRGVGLGLSIAQQVIKQHKGWIDVKSELGKGSTFTIYLRR